MRRCDRVCQREGGKVDKASSGVVMGGLLQRTCNQASGMRVHLRRHEGGLPPAVQRWDQVRSQGRRVCAYIGGMSIQVSPTRAGENGWGGISKEFCYSLLSLPLASTRLSYLLCNDFHLWPSFLRALIVFHCYPILFTWLPSYFNWIQLFIPWNTVTMTETTIKTSMVTTSTS
jgi:hypothetical protein